MLMTPNGLRVIDLIIQIFYLFLKSYKIRNGVNMGGKSVCDGIAAYKRQILLCFQHETVEGYRRYFNQIVG